MADGKLTAQTELTAPALRDLLYIVDVSNTTDDAAGSSRKITNEVNAGKFLRSSLIDGLTISNNGTDATNDLDIAAGVATVTDGTTWRVAELASSLTKQLDATWAVGTNQGGLDTGTASDTTYHIWLIMRSDTGVVDVLFSTSASAPTMPSNYDFKRLIGSLVRVSGAWQSFVQNQDTFLLKVPASELGASNPGTSAVTTGFTRLPTGLKLRPICTWSLIDTGSNGQITRLLVTSPDQTDTAPATGLFTCRCDTTAAASSKENDSVQIDNLWTNTSAQLRYRLDRSDAAVFVFASIFGWIHPRGKNAA